MIASIFGFFTEGELYPLTDTILNTVNNVKKYIQLSIIAQSLLEGCDVTLIKYK